MWLLQILLIPQEPDQSYVFPEQENHIKSTFNYFNLLSKLKSLSHPLFGIDTEDPGGLFHEIFLQLFSSIIFKISIFDLLYKILSTIKKLQTFYF